MLPLAFDDEVVRKLLIIDYEKIALPNRFVNRLPYRHFLKVLATSDGLSVFKGDGLVIPKLGVTVILEILLYEILKLVACPVRFSARRSFG